MDRRVLTHDEAVREVYRLTPQIREYDEFMYLGVRWLPYTMFFHHKNYRSDVINTDDLGFRLSTFGDVRDVSVANLSKGRSVNLLVGGSTALGTGATADSHTVASRLAAWTGEPWLNFSGRGYNAVQEVLMYMMHQHRFEQINHIVVLSGINTLALEGQPDELATDHGRYYYSFEYQHYMNRYNDDLKRRARTYASTLDGREKNFISRYINRLLSEDNPADVVITDDGTDTDARVKRAAWVVSNAMKQWQQLLAGTGTKLSFVLQPMSSWTRDHLTLDEADIFHAIDSCPNNFWRLFARILGKEIHAPFADGIHEVCETRKIGFADMNVLLRDSPVIDDYLFVDRVHFNDKGYDEVARLIANKVL
ncbi:SGNH/GDSL hydrolase family protein [Paraburkholderia sp. 32]|uniref:SGNH/GDSL hydrolase family protein n=1 Tax=Paraburkholderia sp. 32 TaxID=2991057 RepID=UPI003D2472FB